MSLREGPSMEPSGMSEMIHDTRDMICESFEDISSALNEVEATDPENGSPPSPNPFSEHLTKSAETFKKVVEKARSIRMLLFNDLNDVSYPDYQVAMKNFIKSTDTKRWTEDQADESLVHPSPMLQSTPTPTELDDEPELPCFGLARCPSEMQWQIARKLALKDLHKTKSSLMTISAAMRNIFFWQQRVKHCTQRLPSTSSSEKGARSEDENAVCDLFLGGSCNPTTWRQDTAIPLCKEYNLSYYNPQVSDWHEGLVEIEANAKENATVLLFVIDNHTRALASCLEATEHICVGRQVSLVVMPNLEPGSVVDGEVINRGECKDLNRARGYLRDVARRHGCVVHATVELAMEQVREVIEDENCGMF